MDAIKDYASVFEHLAHTEQKHDHELFAAGHKLALDKCSYYLTDFKRHGPSLKYRWIQDLPGELHLNETFHHNLVRVPRLQPNQAHKTLGHNLALDGNNKQHLKIMQQKLRAWTNKVKTSALCGYDRIAACCRLNSARSSQVSYLQSD